MDYKNPALILALIITIPIWVPFVIINVGLHILGHFALWLAVQCLCASQKLANLNKWCERKKECLTDIMKRWGGYVE